MRLNSKGKAVTGGIFFSIVLIVLGNILKNNAEDGGHIGELPFKIELDQCRNDSATFITTGPGTTSYRTWYNYPLRPVIDGELAGTACPSVSVDAGTINISMEAADGYRKAATYVPVIYLPNGAYATLSYEIIDSQGAAIGDGVSVLALGPDTNSPYSRTAVPSPPSPPPLAPGQTAAASPSPSPPPPSGTCTNTCGWASDNACDDGGGGASYSLCSYGSDCIDCGPRGISSGRRLDDEAAPLADSVSRDTQLARKMNAAERATERAVEAASVTEVDEDLRPHEAVVVPAPGSRRLLKGGSSGGSSGSPARGGATGSGRWGTSSPTNRVVSTSTPRTYSSGGRTYYSSGRSYSYSTSSNAIPRSSRVVVVRRGYYGCYGCYYGCYSCGRPYRNCRSRASCSHTPEISTLNNLDRYEVQSDSSTFITPADGAAAWPLYLVIHNFTTFVDTTNAASANDAVNAYFSFYTDDGQSEESAGSALNVVGWIGLIAGSVFFVIFAKNLHETPKFLAKTQNTSFTPSYSQPSQPIPAAMPTAMPTAMPVAYPSGGGAMPTAMPVAYPGQAPAYPGGSAYPAYPTAYPSRPPSPPADDDAPVSVDHSKSV